MQKLNLLSPFVILKDNKPVLFFEYDYTKYNEENIYQQVYDLFNEKNDKKIDIKIMEVYRIRDINLYIKNNSNTNNNILNEIKDINNEISKKYDKLNSLEYELKRTKDRMLLGYT